MNSTSPLPRCPFNPGALSWGSNSFNGGIFWVGKKDTLLPHLEATFPLWDGGQFWDGMQAPTPLLQVFIDDLSSPIIYGKKWGIILVWGSKENHAHFIL